MHQPQSASIESKASWTVAAAALVTMLMAYGAAWITAVALRDIAAEAAGARSVPALATSLAWLGGGLGGILMGRIADKIGTRWTVLFGAVMIGVGLCALDARAAVAAMDRARPVHRPARHRRHQRAALHLCQPLVRSPPRLGAGADLERLVSRRRAVADPVRARHRACRLARDDALVRARRGRGDRAAGAVLMPHPPELVHAAAASGAARSEARVLGLKSNTVFALMCAAAVLCCIPMAMPQGHLVAFCGDLGISRTVGAAMLSVLLGTAFLSRQIWGAISDRIGGLRTVLIGSALQGASMIAFLLTQSEAGLFTVSAAFGLGFSGIIPAYVLALRELFHGAEASWRIPTLLLFSGTGMALGGWMAGALYDHFGYYAPAFATGIGSNLLNLVVVGALVLRTMTVRRKVIA